MHPRDSVASVANTNLRNQFFLISVLHHAAMDLFLSLEVCQSNDILLTVASSSELSSAAAMYIMRF